MRGIKIQKCPNLDYAFLPLGTDIFQKKKSDSFLKRKQFTTKAAWFKHGNTETRCGRSLLYKEGYPIVLNSLN